MPKVKHPASGASSKSFSQLRRSSMTLLKTPQWWRQQVWAISSEITLSLLAAIGLIRGVSATKVAIGMALVYGIASVASLPLARGGKGRLAAVGFITIAFAVAAGVQEGKAGWWWLACASGGLMAFRDSAYITAAAWSPWRARQSGTSTLSMAAVSQALGIILAALATILSAVLQNAWGSWSAVVVILALGLGIPDAFMQKIRQRSVRNPLEAFTQTWQLPDTRSSGARPLITTAILFSSAHMMGRRLLLPFLILAFVSRAGGSENALVYVGLAMGSLSALSLTLRYALPPPSSPYPYSWFRVGLAVNIASWVVILILAWIHPHLPLVPSALMLFFAWLAMEVAGRRWSVGYLDSLRALSHAVSARKNRAHRELLVADVVSRNSVGALGMALGGVASFALPLVMACLLALCAWRLHKYDRLPRQKGH